jgi:hypothetical protein
MAVMPGVTKHIVLGLTIMSPDYGLATTGISTKLDASISDSDLGSYRHIRQFNSIAYVTEINIYTDINKTDRFEY